MKTTVFSLSFLLMLASFLQADGHVLRASYPDGTGLEIFTQSTGSTQIDSEGLMGLSGDFVMRFVLDRDKNILFTYNLVASRGKTPESVAIRIEPFNESPQSWLEDFAKTGLRFSGPHFPTVAAVREFPSVKMGEVVTLDILYNPSTGEKIYDVLRPLVSSPRERMLVQAIDARETISLKEIALRVNGKTMPAPTSWMIGAAVRIDIPGHGAYVLAADDPHSASPDRAFTAVARADGKTLTWAIGDDRIEVTSATNVLTRSPKGTLWVYHDPQFRSQDQPNAPRLQAADTVDWLLPKK